MDVDPAGEGAAGGVEVAKERKLTKRPLGEIAPRSDWLLAAAPAARLAGVVVSVARSRT